jgi:uncharacterized membrane protein YgcG
MKKLLVGLLVAVSLLLNLPAPASAAVNNFRITNFDIKYELGQTADKHSTLTTTEKITAEFPTYDQNHGLERAIPTSYDDHKVDLDIESVTDQSGAASNYTTYGDGAGNEVLRIGDADKYVHGSQTYVIRYKQQDVTKYFSDTNDDEFYWDTNGTQWQVPVDKLHVSVVVAPGLRDALSGTTACYQGPDGYTQPCDFASSGPGTYEVNATGLAAFNNVSIVLGFQPHTFAVYTQSLKDRLFLYWVLWLVASLILAGIVLIVLIIRAMRLYNRSSEHTTIVPEYTPPQDMSVSAAAKLYPQYRGELTAQLLDLAVRGYLKVYETRAKSFFRRAQYRLEITKDISDLREEEKEILTDIFDTAAVGSTLNLEDLRKDRSKQMNLIDNPQKLAKRIRGTYGLRDKDPAVNARLRRTAKWLLVISVITLTPWFLIPAVTAFVLSFVLYPLTDKGLAAYHYLEGLKMYIKTAETDRIKMLQSPEGAEKTGGIDPNDPAQLIKLYEKLLPYAVLFGVEKDWNKQLGKYYENLGSQPNWYAGQHGFTAAAFSSSLSSFNTVSNYAAPSSSGSGGSGGGGSSGGGGGGGGGGGW